MPTPGTSEPLPFSDFIVYVDESGDHGLRRIDPSYPVFVLAFCIFRKETYVEECVPSLQRFKFDFFGHDMVVLHEREIRKAQGPFSVLVNSEKRAAFMQRLSDLLSIARFTLVSSVIDKRKLREQYPIPRNPYDLALAFCMERLHFFLKENDEWGRTVYVVFESRGRREDDQLELVFRRVAAGNNMHGEPLALEPLFVSKKANCSGLQIADLVARPIGVHVQRPDQPNRAYEVIRQKFRTSAQSRYMAQAKEVLGYGLKVFP